MKRIYQAYKEYRAFTNKYHVTSILYLIAILTVLAIALMYTEFLNNSILVDAPGIGKLLRIPRVAAITGSMGSWLGVPNINEGLLLTILLMIMALVVIFIGKILVGGIMNWLFIVVFGLIGKIAYAVLGNYKMGADMLYTNDLLGIHIMRIIGKEERTALIQEAIERFVEMYNSREGVTLKPVSHENLSTIFEQVAGGQTREEISNKVMEYLLDNHVVMNGSEGHLSNTAVLQDWLWEGAIWVYHHPVSVIVAITALVICVWWGSSGPTMGGAVNNLAQQQGGAIRATTEALDTHAQSVYQTQNKIISAVERLICNGEYERRENNLIKEEVKDLSNLILAQRVELDVLTRNFNGFITEIADIVVSK